MIRPAAKKVKTYTVEEYFELEKHSDIRHEFVNGKLIPMPGESVIANRIAGNCSLRLQLALEDKGYDIIRHDVRTIIKDNEIYRYPDVQAAKRSEITQTHAVTKPVLIIEVSSQGSLKTNHETKLQEYIGLASVEYYLIISQFEPLVQLYSRDEYGWRFEAFSELDEAFYLKKLDFTFKMKEIYKNVTFADNQSDE